MDALLALGRGFLAHPGNVTLRQAVRDGSLTPEDYFQELLRIAYRLIVLLTAEDRGVLHTPDTPDEVRQIYEAQHAIGRLRDGATRPMEVDDEPDDWQAVQVVFRGLASGDPRLGLPRLEGLFAAAQCPRVDASRIDNRSLLSAVFHLSWIRDKTALSRVNWSDMNPEELGCLHETLLELVPQFDDGAAAFRFGSRQEPGGHARRTSGSYYTPEALVRVLLDRALDPVVESTVAAHPDRASSALLRLTIVDPACGCGHFLLAAARRLATAVARHGSQGIPSPAEYHEALRQVVFKCLFGVDLNPLAVELCKVSLWLEAADPGRPLSSLDSHIQLGHALFGVAPASPIVSRSEVVTTGVDGSDSKPIEDIESDARDRERFEADLRCAAFVGVESGRVSGDLRNEVDRLQRQYHFFHWHLAFPEVFGRGGFDLVLGNPPWIAHAGRAAQPLPAGVKKFYRATYPAFAGYPTTHGMFIGLAARLLRPGGAVALIVPSSVSELDKYEPARRAHDDLCDMPDALVDFGEGRFPGVTQPCMALVSWRRAGGRSGGSSGSPWPMERPDLDDTGSALLARLAGLSTFPREMFGERGFQSDSATQDEFVDAGSPTGRFTTPLRVGSDVREFQLLAPRMYADPIALAGRMRGPDEFHGVRIVVRNTARYPIAALSDGMAFRNSLLAGFESPDWPAAALVALLNSSLIRWHHYMRFRDARQPIMPQVKIGHLRAIPRPPCDPVQAVACLQPIGERLSRDNAALSPADRAALDARVFDLFGIRGAERSIVSEWHERVHQALGGVRNRHANR